MIFLVVGVVLYFAFRGLRDRVVGAPTVGWAPDTNWRVVAPLARTNVRLVLRHPAFVAGALFTPLMLFASTESANSWRYASTGIALGLVPLARLAQNRGIEIAGLSRSDRSNRAFQGLNIEVFSADLCDQKSLSAVFEKHFDAVIHCAAHIHIGWKFLDKGMQVNREGTRCLLDEARRWRWRRCPRRERRAGR